MVVSILYNNFADIYADHAHARIAQGKTAEVFAASVQSAAAGVIKLFIGASPTRYN